MPFFAKDWRSPGEAWIKTDDGWEKQKILECRMNNPSTNSSSSSSSRLCTAVLPNHSQVHQRGCRFQRSQRRSTSIGFPQRRSRRTPVPVHGQAAGTASLPAQNYHSLRLCSEIRPQRPGGNRRSSSRKSAEWTRPVETLVGSASDRSRGFVVGPAARLVSLMGTTRPDYRSYRRHCLHHSNCISPKSGR